MAGGIWHFETARSYGRGFSEKLLGEFFRAHGGAFAVSTKCGASYIKTNACPTFIALPLNRMIRRFRDIGNVAGGGPPSRKALEGLRREAGSGENPEILNPKSRIRWLEPVKPEKVVETIGKYDALVVPSVCLETGPLVVLEAFAAGVPVIGSRLGGIAEMVRDGVDGLLFEAGSPEDLADKIQGFHRRMKNIKAGVPRVKNSREVGYEHLKSYQQLLSE